jgi:hypothetical protein
MFSKIFVGFTSTIFMMMCFFEGSPPEVIGL